MATVHGLFIELPASGPFNCMRPDKLQIRRKRERATMVHAVWPTRPLQSVLGAARGYWPPFKGPGKLSSPIEHLSE